MGTDRLEQLQILSAAHLAGFEVIIHGRGRELPVMVRMQDGTLVEGRIDFAWSDGSMWSAVDYKTDRRETSWRTSSQSLEVARAIFPSSTVGMQAREVTQKRHRLTQNDARITRKITREKEPGECRLQPRLFPYVGENGAVWPSDQKRRAETGCGKFGEVALVNANWGVGR